jgi:flagellar biosynthesis/type III secretory pathway protein FliH
MEHGLGSIIKMYDIRELIKRSKSDIDGILSDLESDIESYIEEEKRNSYDEGYNKGYEDGEKGV